MEEGLFHNPIFVNHVNEFAVAAVGHMEGHTEEDRVNPATGATTKVCPHYDTIPCSAHQATYQGAGNRFEFSGVPASFIADSSGAKVSEVNGQAPQQFIDKITEAQTKIGQRPILGSQIARWMGEVNRGDAKATQGKFKDSLAAYNKVIEDETIPEFVRARAQQKVVDLNARIIAAVDAAKALAPVPARRELKKLVKDLKDFPEGKAAAEAALAELEGAPASGE